MKIRSIDLLEVRVPFRFSFRHASKSRAAAHALLVRVTTNTGIEGWGEAHPRPYLTGETIESCRHYCRDFGAELLRTLQFSAGEPPWNTLTQAYLHADQNRALAM